MTKYDLSNFSRNENLMHSLLKYFPNLFSDTPGDKEISEFTFFHLATFAHREAKGDVKLFNQKIRAIIDNLAIDVGDKKLMVNIILYGLSAADIFDRDQFLIGFIDEFRDEIDFDAVFTGDRVFGTFENNLLKCLIYNEKWHSLNALFAYFNQKNIQFPLDHKDIKGRADIVALIVNCAPSKIVEQYLQYVKESNHQIDWFAKDADGYSPIELLIAFGRSDILQEIKDEIFKELQSNPSSRQLISDANHISLEQVNGIMMNNGAGHALNPNVCVVANFVKSPINRPNNYDVPLRTQIALDNKLAEFVKNNPMAKRVELWLQQNSNDEQLIQIFNGIDVHNCAEVVEARGHRNKLFMMNVDGISVLVDRDVNKEGRYPNNARAEFFDEEEKKKTRRQTIEKGRAEIAKVLIIDNEKNDNIEAPLLSSELSNQEPEPKSPSCFSVLKAAKKVLSNCIHARSQS